MRTSITPVQATFDAEAMFMLPSDAFKIYMWMVTYLPKYGHEMSYRELASILQMATSTVTKYVNLLVAEGYIERTANAGIPATYKVLR